MTAISVQMQPVVVAPPDRADGVRFFENDRVETALAQGRRRGQAGRTSADNDDVE